MLAIEKCEAIPNKILSIAGNINVSNQNSTIFIFILSHYLYIITMFIEFYK